MYIVGELLGLLFGFLFSTLLLIGTTWQRLLQCDLDSQNNFGFTILRVLREFILTAFLYVAFILIYVFGQGIFVAELGYDVLQFRFGSMLLSLLFGVYLVIGIVFAKPTWKTVVYLVGLLIAFIIWFVPGPPFEEIENYGYLFLGLVYFWIFQVVFLGLIAFLEYQNVIKKPEPFWDISEKFKVVSRKGVIFVFWLLFCLETFLRFNGYSIFFF